MLMAIYSKLDATCFFCAFARQETKGAGGNICKKCPLKLATGGHAGCFTPYDYADQPREFYTYLKTIYGQLLTNGGGIVA